MDRGLTSKVSEQTLHESFFEKPPSKSLFPEETPMQPQHGQVSPGLFIIGASNGIAVHLRAVGAVCASAQTVTADCLVQRRVIRILPIWSFLADRLFHRLPCCMAADRGLEVISSRCMRCSKFGRQLLPLNRCKQTTFSIRWKRDEGLMQSV